MQRPENLPASKRFKDALLSIMGNLSEKELRMLTLLYYADKSTMSSSELANALGDSGQANILFGAVGHKVSDAMGFKPGRRSNGTYQWWNVLAMGPIDVQNFRWTMHPELAEALVAIGLVKEKTVV